MILLLFLLVCFFGILYEKIKYLCVKLNLWAKITAGNEDLFYKKNFGNFKQGKNINSNMEPGTSWIKDKEQGTIEFLGKSCISSSPTKVFQSRFFWYMDKVLWISFCVSFPIEHSFIELTIQSFHFMVFPYIYTIWSKDSFCLEIHFK